MKFLWLKKDSDFGVLIDRLSPENNFEGNQKVKYTMYGKNDTEIMSYNKIKYIKNYSTIIFHGDGQFLFDLPLKTITDVKKIDEKSFKIIIQKSPNSSFLIEFLD